MEMDLGSAGLDSSARKAPWRAGEAAPALSMTSGFGSKLGSLAAVCGAFFLCVAHPMGWAAEAFKICFFISSEGMSKALGVLGSEKAGRASARRAGKIFACEIGKSLCVMGKGGAGLLNFPLRAGQKALEKAGLRADLTGPLKKFGNLAQMKSQALAKQSEEIWESSCAAMGPKGSWMRACDALLDRDPARAAKIWQSSPFNPEWKTRFSDPNGKWHRRAPFYEALENWARNCGPEEAAFLRGMAQAMRSELERRELDKLGNAQGADECLGGVLKSAGRAARI